MVVNVNYFVTIKYLNWDFKIIDIDFNIVIYCFPLLLVVIYSNIDILCIFSSVIWKYRKWIKEDLKRVQ